MPRSTSPGSSRRIPRTPTASAIAAKFGFLNLVPKSRNPDDFCSISMKPSAPLLNTTTLTGRLCCTRVKKSPISIVKPPSPDNEITCHRGNADWAPIACDMALAMEPCQNDDALHRVCARTPNIRIGTERTFRNEPRVTALGVTLHDRPPLMEFACRFDTQCARPLEDTTD